MPALRAALLVLTACTLAAGCGGGGSGADEKKIASVVTEALDGRTKGAECRLSTEHLVTAVWGSLASCNRQSSGGRGTTVKVSGTKVDGKRATTTIDTKFQKLAISGSLELRKVGADWRIDEFGNDLVRSLLVEALPAGYAESLDGVKNPERLFADGAVKGCLKTDLQKLPGDQQRAIGYAIFGNRKGTAEEKDVQNLLVECMSKSDSGRQALRAAFELGIRQESLPQSVTDCVITKLRQTADDELIAREIVRRQKSGGELGAELSALARDAVAGCRRSATN